MFLNGDAAAAMGQRECAVFFGSFSLILIFGMRFLILTVFLNLNEFEFKMTVILKVLFLQIFNF
jgi:hypothetical protein